MNWDDFPLTLRTHLADIFDIHEKTIRRRVLRLSSRVPPPAFVEPYGWRREDVRRFYEASSARYDRRAMADDRASV